MTNFIRHKNLTKVDELILKKSLRHSVDKHLPAICPFYYKVTVLSRLLQCSTYQWTAWPATSCGAHQDSNPPRVVVVKSGVVFNQSSQCLKWPHGTCVVCRLLLLPCGVINDDLLQRVPMEVSAKQWDDNVWIKLSEWRQKTASHVIVIDSVFRYCSFHARGPVSWPGRLVCRPWSVWQVVPHELRLRMFWNSQPVKTDQRVNDMVDRLQMEDESCCCINTDCDRRSK